MHGVPKFSSLVCTWPDIASDISDIKDKLKALFEHERAETLSANSRFEQDA